jgi:hypothetical protein
VYKICESAGEAARKEAKSRPPFGPGFSPELASRGAKLEVFGSSFTDAGGDCCLFVLRDSEGREIGRREIDGY